MMGPTGGIVHPFLLRKLHQVQASCYRYIPHELIIESLHDDGELWSNLYAIAPFLVCWEMWGREAMPPSYALHFV